MMDRKTAISRAKEKLVGSSALNECLNRTGFVRVMPLLDLPTIPPQEVVNEPLPSHVVTFTIEETYFGRRLMAEYQGVKEFAA